MYALLLIFQSHPVGQFGVFAGSIVPLDFMFEVNWKACRFLDGYSLIPSSLHSSSFFSFCLFAYVLLIIKFLRLGCAALSFSRDYETKAP